MGMVYSHPPFFFYIFIVICKVTNPFFQVVQATFMVEEITNSCYQQLDDERTRRVAAVESFNIAD